MIIILIYFSGKVLKFVHDPTLIFSRFDFFSSSVHFFLLEGRQNSLLSSESVKVAKQMIVIWFRKWLQIIRFPSEIKNLPIEPVISNWFKFIKKAPIINDSRISKSFKSFFFSLKFES